jgi:threonine/homoserine/homoserine lactone efflux protein
MGLDLFLAFIAATLVLCILPGPVVTWLVACGIRGGPNASLTGLAGTTSAIIVHMCLLLAGLAPLLAAMGTYMEVLKLIGAAYLIWIGIAAFRAPIEDPALSAAVPPDSKVRIFRRGFLIGVTNPKPLAFYAAFPQNLPHRSFSCLRSPLLWSRSCPMAPMRWPQAGSRLISRDSARSASATGSQAPCSSHQAQRLRL